MSSTTTALRRAYRFHGVAIVVAAEDGAVIDAVDLRLRDFRQPDDNGTAPDLTIAFVADRSAATEPAGPGRPVYETPHGTLDYYPESDSLYGTFGGVVLRCDASAGTAVLAADAFTSRDLYLATHPLLTLSVMELLERRGLYCLHAACLIEGDGPGVLLAGPSGAGKSTLTLALARAGMSCLSDDIVFLEPGADSVHVLGFADTIGLTDHAAAQFAELRPLLDTPPADGFPKRLHRIEDLFGATPVQMCEPRALVFPRVTRDEPSALAALDPGDALLSLVPDVLLTNPVSTKAHLDAIAALLDQVRCYTLNSGVDLEGAVELVRAIV